jgi:hypothetical protein
MSGRSSPKNAFDQILIRPEGEVESGHPVMQALGFEPLRKPLPEGLAPLEKIKIFARDGCLHFYGQKNADFERIWAQAFPDDNRTGMGKDELGR